MVKDRLEMHERLDGNAVVAIIKQPTDSIGWEYTLDERDRETLFYSESLPTVSQFRSI